MLWAFYQGWADRRWRSAFSRQLLGLVKEPTLSWGALSHLLWAYSFDAYSCSGRSFSTNCPSLNSSGCSAMFIGYDFLFSRPLLKLAVVWIEPAKGRAKLSHQGLLMAVLVAMSQYQHLCSDNVTFWGGWEAEAWLCMAFWNATATWVQTWALYNWCRYLLLPETQRRFFFFSELLLKIILWVDADWHSHDEPRWEEGASFVQSWSKLYLWDLSSSTTLPSLSSL